MERAFFFLITFGWIFWWRLSKISQFWLFKLEAILMNEVFYDENFNPNLNNLFFFFVSLILELILEFRMKQSTSSSSELINQLRYGVIKHCWCDIFYWYCAQFSYNICWTWWWGCVRSKNYSCQLFTKLVHHRSPLMLALWYFQRFRSYRRRKSRKIFFLFVKRKESNKK